MNKAALAAQVGGDHYKKGIQPFQLSMANGHDACIHAIQKYLTRHRRQPEEKGYEALRKAHHICMIRVGCMETYGVVHAPEEPLIRIEDYIRSNEIPQTDATAVHAVEVWSRQIAVDHLAVAESIRSEIRFVAERAYPHRYQREDFTA